ncbi:FHA domain-containing protein [Clostridium frigidicarnis]|uniref:FHA domain-containing protein n=1 Tax=Clostridium frigidicarnis TaxID=84698 RepID=A0A1I0VWE6_9CLOT|nr:FHA domain-containing protein [Clostridium frigidicarnis]SFA80223.1 FHA domain-containing protein [Clostridium frigidicarnis]
MKENNFKYSANNNKLLTSIQIINLCIGVIVTLIGVFAYIAIESSLIKSIFIAVLIVCGTGCFISLLRKTHKEQNLDNEYAINTIALINEDNDVIREWIVSEKVSILIGKKTLNNEVHIDLTSSIYSLLIENEHAVLNHSGGRWYVEDLCSENGVSIQKIEDGEKYRLIKYSPCTIKKGDILFIAKAKLLLR